MRHAISILVSAVLALGARAEVTGDSLRAAADYHAGRRGTALLVIRDGKVVLKEGKTSAGAKIYSGTKAFWCLAALAANEDGILRLDEKMGDLLEEWSGDGRKSAVTVRQLLSFSSGLNDAFSLHNDGWENRNAHALKQPLAGTPGSSFIYGPAALQVFHEALKRRLIPRGETPTKYLERRVLRPMGLGKQRYLADKQGNPLLAAGFIMSAEQWAKIGRVLAKDGAPVLRSGLGAAKGGSAANPMYAFGIWSNRLAARPGARELDPEDLLELKWHQQRWSGSCLSHSAPQDLLACIGSGGQRIYVSPSEKLIVVRQGGLSKFSDGTFLRLLFRGR